MRIKRFDLCNGQPRKFNLGFMELKFSEPFISLMKTHNNSAFRVSLIELSLLERARIRRYCICLNNERRYLRINILLQR